MHLKLDLHLHSEHSGEAFGTIEKIVLCAKSAGLDGFALTDHKRFQVTRKPRALQKSTGLFSFPDAR